MSTDLIGPVIGLLRGLSRNDAATGVGHSGAQSPTAVGLPMAWACLAAIAIPATQAQSILDNTSHQVTQLTGTLSDLGATNIVDQTCPKGGTGWSGTSLCGGTDPNNTSYILPYTLLPGYALLPAGTSYAGSTVQFDAANSATPDDHHPYTLINSSTTGYLLSDDQSLYSQMIQNGMLMSVSYCPLINGQDDTGNTNAQNLTTSAGWYPPIVLANVQADQQGECGAYGYGVEFSLPQGTFGMDGSTSSAAATLTAILGWIKDNHPSWTWQDVKGALRQTASNWSSGWMLCATCSSPNWSGYGYGDVNWTAANAISNISGIYLQPPGFVLTPNSNSQKSASFTLYPFTTSRRAGEVIYAFHQSPVQGFPSPSSTNEYLYSQISSLISSYGGSLIYNSNGAGGVEIPSPYTATVTGTVYFVAFTVDNTSNLSAAHFSRPETFSVLSSHFFVPNPKLISVIVPSITKLLGN